MKRVIYVFVVLLIGCSDHQTTLLELHNQKRADNNRSELVLDDYLSKIATKQAEWMAKKDVLTHEDNKGRLPWNRVNDSYVRVGENIAYTGLDASYDDVFKMWLDSKEHKKNVLGSYDRVGFGRAENKKYTYWVALFGKKKT